MLTAILLMIILVLLIIITNQLRTIQAFASTFQELLDLLTGGDEEC